MVARKHRLPVVIDTNVFIRSFKARTNTNPNRRIIRLWLLEKRLQLILSQEMMEEYLEIFDRVIGLDEEIVEQWQIRFNQDQRTTVVGLARRYVESRDPDDNILLATAIAGRAKTIITNDRDLLELPEEFKSTLPFAVETPQSFLRRLES